ncbi:MAG: magnesium/cobalt transporter CorA [Armatimonadota bacterium]
MINLLYLDRNGQITKSDSLEKARELYLKKNTIFWLDIESTSSKESEDILGNIFKFHPLAIEDCISSTHHPKLDNYGEYLFLIVHGVTPLAKSADFNTNEVDIFISKNFLITFHNKSLDFINNTMSRIEKNPAILEEGPSRILYYLMDCMVETYTPVVEALDKAIDGIENEIFENPTDSTLNKTFRLKRKLMRLKRTASYQREVFLELSRTTSPVIEKDMLIYFRDVYDYLLRFSDIADSYRDIVTSAIDTYLSVVSNKMNSIMKVLTIIATIMMPLTLIAGIYGMNFDYMPELKIKYAYFIVLGIMGITTIFMLYVFKKKKWM